MKKILWAAIAFFSSVIVAMAANNITVIKAGHMIDVIDGKILDNRIIIIEGKRIKQIVEGGPNVRIPDGATVIDLSQSD